MRKGFLWRVALPVAVGVWLALWLMLGDTKADDSFLATVIIKEENSLSMNGFKTFELRFTNGTAVTVMGSESVDIIKYLDKHNMVVLELQPRYLQKIER